MRWLDRDEDAGRYQGHQYTWISIDEAGNWPSPSPIDKLRATLRSPYGIPCVLRLTANPGGVGQQWLSSRYVRPSQPGVPFYDEERRTWRVYIPSKLRDNPSLVENDPGYEDRLRSSGPPWLVRAWLDGDWDASSGLPLFSEDILLVDGKPIPSPPFCKYVFAVIDTAVKSGVEHDGTAVTYYAYNPYVKAGVHTLTILDYEIVSIDGAFLDEWVPGVFRRLQELKVDCKAQMGSGGVFVEDAVTGAVLLQEGKSRGWPVHGIDTKLTAMGKDGRAQAVMGYAYRGLVKISDYAHRKKVQWKDVFDNHLLLQVTNFRLGDKDAHKRADDLFDTFTYGVWLGCGEGSEYMR
jgi:hypothetical protein